MLIASYQTLNIANEDDEAQFWHDNYPPGHFSHIIIDEAHRSAWRKWSVILSDNPNAVHIGLTATPRTRRARRTTVAAQDEAITAHNLEYFGDPVYEYTLGRVRKTATWRHARWSGAASTSTTTASRSDIEAKSATDPYTGRTIAPDEIASEYSAKKYETKLMLPDRVAAMAEDLFALLLSTGGPHQKTIVFCARDSHATQVQIALNNIYEDWCKREMTAPKEWFAFQCTGNPDLRPPAPELIAEMKGSRHSHSSRQRSTYCRPASTFPT